MDRLPVRASSNPMRGRRARREARNTAEADLAMRLLIGALILVLTGVVAASSLVQLGGFRTSDATDPSACIRLADTAAYQCATRTEVADRLILSRSLH
jgi:hypothetical protein